MSLIDPDAPIPAVLMRGGTSKGVFLHSRDLPPAGPERDDLLLRIMGSPDPMQIDGMGGTFSSTSKVIVVEPGPADAVTYWFAQIGVDQAVVDWSGNCGNLTTAVGPFAIQEGLIRAADDMTTVRLINGNTGVHIDALVPTPGRRVAVDGDAQVAGVPGFSAPIVTRYLEPAGGVLGELLPLGSPSVDLSTPDGAVRVSLVDAAHPNVFVKAADLGVRLFDRTVAESNADVELLARVERLRASATVRAGRARDVQEASATLPAVPRIILVAPAVDDDADISVLAFSMGKVHRGLPMTGALCLAAAAGIAGTVVADVLGDTRGAVRIRHPLGVTLVESDRAEHPLRIRSLGVVRTARRLMDGRVHPRPRSTATRRPTPSP